MTPFSKGPVSALLESRLLATLHDKKQVVWIDAEGAFTPFVDRLRQRFVAKDFTTPVLAFRGSFLELMLALEDLGSTLDPTPLLVHLPGYNALPSAQSPDSVRHTPLLELYRSAHSFQPSLATLVADAANGRVAPAEIDAFTRSFEFTLGAADAWLAKAATAGEDRHVEWLRNLSAEGLVEQLIGPEASRLNDVTEVLEQRAEVLFGMTQSWQPPEAQSPTDRLIAWILCVEFVHDLARPPRHEALLPLQKLPAQTVERCEKEAARLRKRHSDAYRGWALGVESWLKAAEQTAPEDLGKVDTFAFEASSIYSGAVQALARGDWARALGWFEAHEASQGFWDEQDPARGWAWSLVGDAARLGTALAQAKRPLARATSLEEALELYTETCAPVDLAHRRFEQRHATLNVSMLHEVTELSAGIERLRGEWLSWADQLTRDFAALCRAHGALPSPELQQRTLFAQAVAPLLSGQDKVALFVLDALRFEMAVELREAMEGPGVQVDLRGRFAELPTVTAVGMNALAPIERGGRLSPVFDKERVTGFRAGEAKVTRPQDRVNAIRQSVGGKPPLTLGLADILNSSVAHLKKQVAQAQLVLVHELALDEAGENGFGVRVFADILRDVAAARHQLELAGLRQFVFTSDHGFLLQRGARSAVEFAGADRRYAFSEVERHDTGSLCVPLSSLQYDGKGFFLFREDTAEFGSSRAPSTFTHGGNSLQERVIPVLRVWRKRAAADTGLRYAIECTAHPPRPDVRRVPGVHQVWVQVSPARDEGQAPLDFASTQPVDVLVRVPERDEMAAGQKPVSVAIKAVAGEGARIATGAVRLVAGTGEWTEVSFTLEGPVDERLPIELVLAQDQSVHASPDATFPVSYVPPPKVVKRGDAQDEEREQPVTPAVPSTNPVATGGWAEKLGDADAGKVFDHLERHRNLNESELVQLLGNARKARAFAARFDAFRPKLTFDVEITVGADGKRYQRM